MVTTRGGSGEGKPPGGREAKLTKKAAAALCLKIDLALREAGRRLGPKSVDFLRSIREQLISPEPKLSKAQRDITNKILLQAASGEPREFVAGEEMMNLAGLRNYATGDGRVSSWEEGFLLSLRDRLDDLLRQNKSSISFSGKQWRIIEEIKQKTYFGLPGEPPEIDLDGIVENEDPDGWPPERDEMAVEHSWDREMVGGYGDDDY
jgi:hypothetical protein